jgi:secondary thiamine-phosphate synthase enzyme
MLTVDACYAARAMAEPETFDIKTTTREEMIDVTALVRAAVKRAGVQEGVAVVFCPHTTAAVTVQENSDPTVKSDMVAHMRRLVPKDAPFKHAEDNSDAHIKSSLIGVSSSIPVTGHKLMLGHWQAIFFCEFDGPRDRRLIVKVIGG